MSVLFSPASGIPGSRWLALWILCLGALMIVLDISIVNVALPSIRADLGFSQTDLVWVVNAYTLTFGGCLLLGGRLGDYYGHRRLFLAGLVLFTLASLLCGVANTRGLLVVARTIQGIGGAVVDAVSLTLVMMLFPEDGGRAKAMGVYGFVCAAGGSIGVLLGGVLTSLLSWHWIFLVNVPVGIALYYLCTKYIPADQKPSAKGRLDVAGAALVTTALMIAVYGIVNGNEMGWLSARTLMTLALAVLLLAGFLVVESRVAEPLVPLRVFANRSISLANIIAILWAAAMFGWFFMSTLYMQRVLDYDPMSIALAFLPANLVMALLSLGASPWLVERFGMRLPLVCGLVLAAVGLALFARAPLHGHFNIDILPGMVLLGLGAGVAFNPLLLIAMGNASPSESGLASGLVNTSFMMGGALGLAVLASIAVAVSGDEVASGGDKAALAHGFGTAFLFGAVFAGIGAALGLLLKAPVQSGSEVRTAH